MKMTIYNYFDDMKMTTDNYFVQVHVNGSVISTSTSPMKPTKK